MRNTVLFRADASPMLGYGHFIRSLALADMMTVAEKYGKMLTADEIRQSNTIEDLFKVVEAYQK